MHTVAKNFIRVGSRGSRLALTQAKQYLERIKERVPNLTWELIEIETSGDRFGQLTPSQVLEQSGKGIFVKEIEEALLKGTIDCAIHSLKDMPAEAPLGLTLCGYQKRGDPRDALVTAEGQTLDELPDDAIIASSSLRRQMQLLELAREKGKNWTLAPLRGNVETRIKRVSEGKFHGVVLSAAGLHRLGLVEHIAQYMDPVVEMVPPYGQGTLVAEVRSDRPDVKNLLESAEDPGTRIVSDLERLVLKAVGGGCLEAVGIYARPAQRDQGDWSSPDEQMELHFYRHSAENPQEDGFRVSLRVTADEAHTISQRLAEFKK